MPAVLATFSDEALTKIRALDTDFEEGDLTQKGYCKKKWQILKPLVDQKVVSTVEKLQQRLEDTDIEECEYFNRMIEIFSDASKYLLFLNGEGKGGNGYICGKNYSKSNDSVFHPVKKQNEFVQRVDTVQKVKTEVTATEINVARKNDNNSSLKPLNNSNTSCNHIENENSNKRKTSIDEDECKINGDIVKKPKVEENETVKINNNHSIDNIMEEKHVNKGSNKKQFKKCELCKQFLNSPELRLYPGHPEGAAEEFVTLTDPKLSLFTGDEIILDEDDSRPLVKVTHFSVYDKNGHLCPIDIGLIENNSLLYFSGYAKPIYEEDRSIEGGLPTRDIGPINEWWMSGYDGGDQCLVGFSTAYAEYYMLDPSPQYEPLLTSVYEKVFLGKIVVEFLLEDENPSLEDLINRVQSAIPPAGVARCTEDSLFRHAQFVCNQVLNFETSFDYLETSLITKSCMRSLISLAGVTFGERQTVPRNNKVMSKLPKSSWSTATTTPLVKDVFERLFKEDLDESRESEKATIRKMCGVCDQCRSSDCGTCSACKKRAEAGFSQVNPLCRRRKCPNIALQEAEESEPDEDDDSSYVRTVGNIDRTCAVATRQSRAGGGRKQVEWEGEPLGHDPRRKFYRSAKVGDATVKTGDCVSVEPSVSSNVPVIGRIMYMWENKQNQKFMHIHWFCRGCETVLGETSDSRELFVVDECENTLLSGIFNVVKVLKIPLSFQWANQEVNISINDNENTFFYQKRYDEKRGRFEDLLPDPPCVDKELEYRYCAACERNLEMKRFETPTVEEKLQESETPSKIEYGVVIWRGEEYRPGHCVFLNPATFRPKNVGPIHKEIKNLNLDKVDESIYPEYYRKLNSDSPQALSAVAPDPFCIGLVQSVFVKISPSSPTKDIYLKILKFYRPEDTQGIHENVGSIDVNRLYASNEEIIVNFSEVAGKCVVVCSENINGDPFIWSQDGPYRFYFSEAYDSEKHQLVDPINGVRKLGDVGKGIGKSKSKSQKKKPIIEDWPRISEPLSCLDVFAGCGGLTEGLHQSGIVKTRWAIEKEESAANAFCLNNPRCTVFTEDCNLLLRMVMNGETRNNKGHKLPQKGQVDILCGGPPCQGFSGMNRFNSRQYSRFKNSLIVTYLSFCDYYRPRFFVLENVRNFVSFKKGMVLKLTLQCLIKMGYQVTFGVLQAGNYGVPQTRRRAIILAAAPGEMLPQFPEPLHVFSPRATLLTVIIDDKKYISNCRWTESAPYRMVTVRDAMSDLPEIGNGFREEEVPYGVDPLSHFQKLMRGERYECTVRDHICKEMGPLVEARIGQIPAERGADWRNLPNIVHRLTDGTYTNKLVYSYHDRKNGDSSRGALRGVCACADGQQSCDPSDRQFNTLIPWCLPHTGNRHHHWAGLYGRLDWDGYFSTTITNPEPMGKQGRVLHPEQNRVVSVRECARSQGFPDYYKFFGSILDKHRQIGNAVPPPLGAALGREIRRCVAIKEKKITKV